MCIFLIYKYLEFTHSICNYKNKYQRKNLLKIMVRSSKILDRDSNIWITKCGVPYVLCHRKLLSFVLKKITNIHYIFKNTNQFYKKQVFHSGQRLGTLYDWQSSIKQPIFIHISNILFKSKRKKTNATSTQNRFKANNSINFEQYPQKLVRSMKINGLLRQLYVN